MIPSYFGGEVLADHCPDNEMAMVHDREAIDVRLNDHPTIGPHVLAGYEPLHQAAADLRPYGSVVDRFKVGHRIRGQGWDRLDRHARRFTLRWLPVLEQDMASGILYNNILNTGHVRDKGNLIFPIRAFDNPKLGLDFILKAIVATQYFHGTFYDLLTGV